jgi:glycyl-tRNA synthetase beta subunit
MEFVVIDKIKRFYVCSSIFYLCLDNNDTTQICKCDDSTTMKKKVDHVKGCVEKYYAAKTAHNQEFASSFVLGLNLVRKQGEPIS